MTHTMTTQPEVWKVVWCEKAAEARSVLVESPK